ncbi:MAG: hypothetical protein AAFV45_11070 [Pseudomonadota bacterium]
MTLLEFLVFLIFVGFFILIFSLMGTGSGLPWGGGPKVSRRSDPELKARKKRRQHDDGHEDDAGGDGGNGD